MTWNAFIVNCAEYLSWINQMHAGLFILTWLQVILEESNKKTKNLRENISPGHEPQNIYPTLPYWQSEKNVRITYKCSQILMIEPQIIMPNPYAASIYGCIRWKQWGLAPPWWEPETFQMIIPDSPKRNGSIVFPTGIDLSMWQQRQPIWSTELGTWSVWVCCRQAWRH
jgi:hypothetical protein